MLNNNQTTNEKPKNFPVFSHKEWAKRTDYNKKIVAKELYACLNKNSELSVIEAALKTDLTKMDTFCLDTWSFFAENASQSTILNFIQILMYKTEVLEDLSIGAAAAEIMKKHGYIDLTMLCEKVVAMEKDLNAGENVLPFEFDYIEERFKQRIGTKYNKSVIDEQLKKYEKYRHDKLLYVLENAVAKFKTNLCTCADRVQWAAAHYQCNIRSDHEQMYDLFW